jgi:hypothetical protein
VSTAFMSTRLMVHSGVEKLIITVPKRYTRKEKNREGHDLPGLEYTHMGDV